ncbi:MAG: DUF1848 family protein [Desulfobacter sp.]|nr:DUF1848 family protein [Desulfobacter sp.]
MPLPNNPKGKSSPLPTLKTIKTTRNRILAKPKIILSASRRTDIPGWYTPWFLDCIDQGYFTVTNPFNQKSRKVDATQDKVHTIVFWSKNFKPFLGLNAHKILADKGYNLFFNFTITPPDPLLEPGIPDLDSRLAQAEQLCSAFDPSQITWRFDPICAYQYQGESKTNLDGFEYILKALSAMGISRCVTSFYDPYKKVNLRIRKMKNSGPFDLEFLPLNSQTQTQVIQKMGKQAESKQMELFLCCQGDLARKLTAETNVMENACINGRLYKKLFGGNPETAGDYGQRRQQGCKCTRSVDVGSYDLHPCFHNCLFCYARTGQDLKPDK